ncbi:MAG: hypothetical protein KKF50_02285 [Nanoarchaeota archaeon]|nr:hypothetical protein [Nanoarchaeota archaeon]
MRKCPSKKVIEKFRNGAREVKVCDSRYNQNAKFVSRDGEGVCTKYHREDIPEECIKD